MKKILFLIHDLGAGGAEKVLVNLVNNMDSEKFNITVMALFGGGVNEQYLKPCIRYIKCFPKEFRGNSHIMKLFSPAFLHKYFIKDKYDIEISYLEGPAARIISGCPDENTKLVSWIHCTMPEMSEIASSFRSKNEARACYNRFHKNVFVSDSARKAFLGACAPDGESIVLYNTNPTDIIVEKSRETAEDCDFPETVFKLCSVGKLMPVKGFERLISVHKRLIDDGFPIHTYILGEGGERTKLETQILENDISDSVTLLGYKTNPYKYVSKCDLFVCSSYSEGFSTAATEALIVGTPVCTAEVSGMKEMLGENDEYGVVTENNEEALYEGVKRLISDSSLLAHYREKTAERACIFNTSETVKAVENMLISL